MQRTRPDLIVLDQELPDVQLVVEVKVGEFDQAAAEQQLTNYMVASSCPLGLLITPQTTWLLEDSYDGTGNTTIRLAGEFVTAELLRLDAIPDSERELTARVHDWLEALAASGNPKYSGASAREGVARYLLPAIVEGRVITESQP